MSAIQMKRLDKKKKIRMIGMAGLLSFLVGLGACGKSDGGDGTGKPPVANSIETLLSTDQVAAFITRDSWCGKTVTESTSISRRVTFNVDRSFGLFETTTCLGGAACAGHATTAGGTGQRGSWFTSSGGYLLLQFGDQTVAWNRYRVFQISAQNEPLKVRLKNDNNLTAFEFENCL